MKNHFYHHLPADQKQLVMQQQSELKKDAAQVIKESYSLESNSAEHMGNTRMVEKSTQVLGSLSRSYHQIANEVKALAHVTRHFCLPESIAKMGI